MDQMAKKCPFCAETIQAEAIKCKHCGEFLQARQDSASASNKTNIPTLDNPNYSQAIFTIVVLILGIIISGLNDLSSSQTTTYAEPILAFIEIRVLLFFRQYLEKIKSNQAVAIMNWIMIFTVILAVLSLIEKLHPGSVISTDEDSLSTLLIALLYIAFIILFIIVHYRLGNALQDITNDPVGLLKELGLTYCYLIPINITILFAAEFSDNSTLRILGTLLETVPWIIMIIIYQRAQQLKSNE
jgi:hypothetical protein